MLIGLLFLDGELKLGRGRTVLDVHLNGRSIGRFAHP
jgi:hypothetical protein